MYERILVPTDGSEVAERAGTAAISLAERFDGELHVISVFTSRGGGEDDATDAVDSIVDAAAAAGLQPATEVLAKHYDDLTHRTILDYAEANGVDAIVMGTHGRTGVNRFLLGSVAELTLRESPIPVVTVHEDTDVAFDVDRILVPTDGSDGAAAAVDHAIDLATDVGATLHFLHVTPSEFVDVTERASSDPIDDAVARADGAGFDNVETAHRFGRPYQEIADYVTEAEIDCIVMGTHGWTGLRRYLLGSVTERTVRFSPVPVISVKAAHVAATI